MSSVTSSDRLPEINRAIKALYRPGDVIEVRAFDKNYGRFVGRYRFDASGLGPAAAIFGHDCENRDVYFVANSTRLPPVDASSEGTKEGDVIRRRWVLLDFDPVRLNKISTDAQFDAALALAHDVKNFLIAEGWSGLFLASSGNGIHLLLPIDLPVDEASKQLVRRVQRTIADKFQTAQVEIECFCDANRLVRAYGSLNKKGVETDVLKWRTSGIIEADEVPPQPISRGQLPRLQRIPRTALQAAR